MRLLIIIMLIVSGLASQAQLQYGIKQNINAKGYVWKEGQFDSSFILPRDTFRVLARDSNALAFKGGCLYVVSSGVWQLLMCATPVSVTPPSPTFAFTIQPQSQSVTTAATFSLTSAVTNGALPLTWSWYQGVSSNVQSTTKSSRYDTLTTLVYASDSFRVVVTDASSTVIYSNKAYITASAPLYFSYGYSATNPYVDNSTIPTFGSVINQGITHNQDLLAAYDAAAVDKFLVFRVPVAESAKITWFVESVNQGTIGDAAWRAPFTIGSFTYYVTRNAAGFSFDYHLPVQLKQ